MVHIEGLFVGDMCVQGHVKQELLKQGHNEETQSWTEV